MPARRVCRGKRQGKYRLKGNMKRTLTKKMIAANAQRTAVAINKKLCNMAYNFEDVDQYIVSEIEETISAIKELEKTLEDCKTDVSDG